MKTKTYDSSHSVDGRPFVPNLHVENGAWAITTMVDAKGLLGQTFAITHLESGSTACFGATVKVLLPILEQLAAVTGAGGRVQDCRSIIETSAKLARVPTFSPRFVVGRLPKGWLR